MAVSPLPINPGGLSGLSNKSSRGFSVGNASNGGNLNVDMRSIEALKGAAARDPKSSIRETAKQFESLFMQEVMKSMRASTMATGMFDNEGSKLGVDMLDSQLATRMAGLPGGLSDIIAKQLERQMGLTPGPIPRAEKANPTPAPLQSAAQPAPEVRVPQTAAATFVQHHTQAAKAAQHKTGIPAEFMISQAALETGWGRKEIRHADGSPAFNLFGIKAGGNWKGPTAEVWTTEFVDGKPQRVKAQFTNSWMFEKQGLRLFMDGMGPGYAFEINTLVSPLNIFIGDVAAEAIKDAELALEKSTASRGLLAVQYNEPDLYGYTDENADAM